MSSREGRSHGSMFCSGKQLVASLFDVGEDYLESLSWSLGDRVTSSDATALYTLSHRGSTRTVTVFEATEHTCLLRLETPTGREKYYGAANADVLDASTPVEWTRTETHPNH